jgi:surface polysaccharide O-acyltransferase-like enzyme
MCQFSEALQITTQWFSAFDRNIYIYIDILVLKVIVWFFLDESFEVEQKCQQVISEMEEVLGESLQKYF